MSHLDDLGNTMSFELKPDEKGFTGRECPAKECEGYFKVQNGTGLTGDGLPCHCPYCGFTAGHNEFHTKEQVEYAKSVAFRRIAEAFHKDLKGLEFDHKPKGAFGIGISMKVTPGRPTPIHSYREKELETEVICSHCTLRYSVYGVFAFCPDCGRHNSIQIFGKNLELVEKMLDLAGDGCGELGEKLVENALEDCVSAFDGFGRELCRVNAIRARIPAKAEKVSFQNLEGARTNLLDLFGLDLSALLDATEWRLAVKCFQKRHLVAHKMGIVDQDYLAKSGDKGAIVGRKIKIDLQEVTSLRVALESLAPRLSDALRPLG